MIPLETYFVVFAVIATVVGLLYQPLCGFYFLFLLAKYLMNQGAHLNEIHTK